MKENEQLQDDVSGRCIKTSFIISPEEICTDMVFNVEFPEDIQQIDLRDGKYTSQDLSVNAKKLGDRYRAFLTENFEPEKDFLSDNEGFAIYLSWLGFTCELYIKSILYYNQNPNEPRMITGHDLIDLYREILPDMKNKIQSDFSLQLPHLVFENELKEIGLFFKRFRYAYEIDGYSVNLIASQTILEILKKHTDLNQ